jgi:hypothetical protein
VRSFNDSCRIEPLKTRKPPSVALTAPAAFLNPYLGLASSPYRLKSWVGYIDTEDKEVVVPQYSDGRDFSGGVCPVKSDDKWHIINQKGNLITKSAYDDVGAFSEGLLPVCRNESWGYIDASGHEVIGFNFRDAGGFSEGLAPVKSSEGLWGYIDKDGRTVVDPQFNSAGLFRHDLAPVSKNDRWGAVDKEGNEVVPCKYDRVRVLSNGLLACYVAKYQAAGNFYENLAPVLTGDRWGFINNNGNEVVAPKYYRVGEFAREVFELSLARPLPGLGPEGELDPPNEGLIMVEENGIGFIDQTGAEVVPLEYEDADHFSEGLAAVKKGGKWGFVDVHGRGVIGAQYAWVSSFHAGRAMFAKQDGGKVGIIDRSGTEIVSTKYDEIKSFSGERALFENWGEQYWLLMRSDGTIDSSSHFDCDDSRNSTESMPKLYVRSPMMEGTENGRWRVLDRDGQIIWREEDFKE